MNQVTLYSSLGPEKGFGPPRRTNEFVSFLKQNGFEVNIITSKLVKEELKSPWYKPSLVLWIKSILKSDIFIFYPAVPAIVPVILSFLRKNVIVDYYAPDFVEFYDKSIHDSKTVNKYRYACYRKKLFLLINSGNVIITSSKESKLFLTGIAYEHGLVPQSLYQEDKNLDSIFPVIPYGISKTDIKEDYSKKIVCDYFANLDFSKPVFVWGGGIWNWFDPFLLIKAVLELKKEGVEFKIIFPGFSKKPKSFMKIDMSNEFYDEVKKQKLEDYIVFENKYLPYDECIALFSSCRAGFSIAIDSLENTLAYRTRILDYIASGLPVIATKGDVLADVIEKYKLGVVIEPGSVNQLAEAIKHISSNDDFFNECKNNIMEIQELFLWSNLLKPLLNITKTNKIKRKKHLLLLYTFFQYSLYRVLFWVADYKNIFGRVKAILSKH